MFTRVELGIPDSTNGVDYYAADHLGTTREELSSMSSNIADATHDGGTILRSIQNSTFGPTNYTFGNGLNGVRRYDSLGRGSGIFVCGGSTSDGCSGGVQTYGMVQAIQGSRVSFAADTILNTTANYNYDEFNRLTGVNNVSRGQAFSNTYDRWGNRWSQTVTQGSGPSPSVSFDVSKNHINGISYDAAGNILGDGLHTYTYDAEGNVITVHGGATATYAYDAFNHRVRTIVGLNDTDFIYNVDGLRVSSWDATTSSPHMLSAYQYWGSLPVAVYTNGQVYYSHHDLLGTQHLITNYAGSSTGNSLSLPFGDAFSPSGTDPDPMHFAFLDHDYESNTDHAEFRQYSPTQGRWMSPDSYNGSMDFSNPQSLNRYSYVNNGPLTSTDPSGLIMLVPPPINPVEITIDALMGAALVGEFVAGLFYHPQFTASTTPRPQIRTRISGGSSDPNPLELPTPNGGVPVNPGYPFVLSTVGFMQTPNNTNQRRTNTPRRAQPTKPGGGVCTLLEHAGAGTAGLGGAAFLVGVGLDATGVDVAAGAALNTIGGALMAVGAVEYGIGDAGIYFGVCK